MSERFISAFENLLGQGNIDTTQDPPVLLPSDERLLSEIVRRAYADGIPIAVVGTGTFPAPRPPRDGVVVSTTALCSVLEVNPEDFIARAQAGTVVDEVVDAAAREGFLLPLDIMSGNTATLGGAFMSGAIGPSAAGYGRFRDAVIGVRCVAADGEIITGGGRTVKNVTGYDITRFLAGTLGIYAIAVDLTMKVVSLPESRLVVTARFHRGVSSAEVVKRLVSGDADITMLEIISPRGLDEETVVAVGVDGLESIVRRTTAVVRNLLSDAGAVSVREESPEAYTEYRRDAGKRLFGPDHCTIPVPPSSSGEILKKVHAISGTMPLLAHPGVGRFYVAAQEKETIRGLREMSLVLGGKHPIQWSRLASDGISSLLTDAELKIARALKRELDPKNILNPHLLT